MNHANQSKTTRMEHSVSLEQLKLETIAATCRPLPAPMPRVQTNHPAAEGTGTADFQLLCKLNINEPCRGTEAGTSLPSGRRG